MADWGLVSLEVFEEHGSHATACHEQMIACTRTGDVKQVALRIVNLLEVGKPAEQSPWLAS